MSCGPGFLAGAAAFFSAHEPILSSLVTALCASFADVRVVAAVDWDQLAQAAVNALTLGSIYASDRPRVHDGLRDPQAAQLRAR